MEPGHSISFKIAVRPANTQISLRIRASWSESSLSDERRFGSLATHRASWEDLDQIAQMRVQYFRKRCAPARL